jgi:hypothetical protein
VRHGRGSAAYPTDDDDTGDSADEHAGPAPSTAKRPAGRGRRSYPARVIELRLTHPAIDFWVDVRLRRFGDTWLAVADLATTPEVGAATRPDLALLLALWPLGPALARRLVERAPVVA